MHLSAVTVLARGLRGRCPACGRGRVFRGRAGAEAPGVASSAPDCDACGWRFERCAGHWVGGNEINLLAAFTAGVAAYAVAAAFLGISHAAAWIATAATGVFSVTSYRRCRAVFFAVDFLLDPVPDAGSYAFRDDDTDGGGDRDHRRDAPDAPRPPAPDGLAARVPANSPESFVPPPSARYSPPCTVSP